jgi:hypothetical protein
LQVAWKVREGEVGRDDVGWLARRAFKSERDAMML